MDIINGEEMRRKQLISNEKKRRKLEICYVCNNKITGNPVYICSSKKHVNGLYRHKRCEPGSVRWSKSEIGKQSVFYTELTGEII